MHEISESGHREETNENVKYFSSRRQVPFFNPKIKAQDDRFCIGFFYNKKKTSLLETNVSSIFFQIFLGINFHVHFFHWVCMLIFHYYSFIFLLWISFYFILLSVFYSLGIWKQILFFYNNSFRWLWVFMIFFWNIHDKIWYKGLI